MFSRAVALTTLLALPALSLSPSAQAQTFGVQTDTQTLGYPGCYNDTTYIPYGTFVSSVADPASAVINTTYNGSMSADVGAWAEARQESSTPTPSPRPRRSTPSRASTPRRPTATVTPTPSIAWL